MKSCNPENDVQRPPRNVVEYVAVIIFLLALSYLMYHGIFRLTFLSDDWGQIGGINLKPFYRFLWTDEYGGKVLRYRPLSRWVFMLEHKPFHSASVPYRAVHFSLFVLNAVLLFFFLRKISGTAAGILGASLFVLHPIHVEPVAWLCSSAELLCTLWVLIGILALSYERKALVIISFVAALMSKEMAVVFPLIALGYYFFISAHASVGDFWRVVVKSRLLLALLFGILLFYLLFRRIIFGSIMGMQDAVSHDYSFPFAILANLLEWVHALMQPLDAKVLSNGFILRNMSFAPVYLFVLLVIGYVWRIGLKGPIAFSLWWTIIALIPMFVTAYVFTGGLLGSERFAFLASAGYSMCLALLFSETISSKEPLLKTLAIGIFFWLAIAGGQSIFEKMSIWEEASRKTREIEKTFKDNKATFAPDTLLLTKNLPDRVEKKGVAIAYVFRNGFVGALKIWGIDNIVAVKQLRALGRRDVQSYPEIWIADFDTLKLKKFSLDLDEIERKRQALFEKIAKNKVLLVWDFPHRLPTPWSYNEDIIRSAETKEGVQLTIRHDPTLKTDITQLKLCSYLFAKFKVRMSAQTLPSGLKSEAQLFWMGKDDTTFHDEKSVVISLITDGNFHQYEIDFSDSVQWLATGELLRLRFDPIDAIAGVAEIDYIALCN
jgi:hypothetical protein